jgi:hypothetical protein
MRRSFLVDGSDALDERIYVFGGALAAHLSRCVAGSGHSDAWMSSWSLLKAALLGRHRQFFRLYRL